MRELIKALNRTRNINDLEVYETFECNGEEVKVYAIESNTKRLKIWNTSNNERISFWNEVKEEIIECLLDGELEGGVFDGWNEIAFEVE